MRLSALKDAVAQDEEGAVIPINDEHGAPYTASDGSDVTVTVVGLQSKARVKADEDEARQIRRIGPPALDPIATRKRNARLAAACVVDWHGWEDEQGAPIPLTKENVVAAISIDDRVLDQVITGIGRHSSFLQKR